MKKLRVGILGATGMVGQRFVTLLAFHPWFEVVVVAASSVSSGKSYEEAVSGRWKLEESIPTMIKNLQVLSVIDDMNSIASQVDLVFCCLDMDKKNIVQIEQSYAGLGVPVISNNSANRWTEDVPMIIPEVNPEHLKLITFQRKNREWDKGCIVVKPNCSIQSYAIILSSLNEFLPTNATVVSLQAVSGAGKTIESWPEMQDNVIPFITGEEEKSEQEPLKIWGSIKGNSIKNAQNPKITATCIRVPVSNGHMAAISVNFAKKITQEKIISCLKVFNPLKGLDLPSSPKQLIIYQDNEDFPQTKLQRNLGNGMGISMGRLRNAKDYDFSFIALSHNTIRGAAGGAILTAELMVKKGYI